MAIHHRNADLTGETLKKRTLLARTIILSLGLFVLVIMGAGFAIFLLTHGTSL